MCSDSYLIPILSLFISSLYPLLFMVSFLFSFFTACMQQSPGVQLVLGQSWMVIPMNKHSPVMCNVFPCMLIENAVVYMKSTLFTKSYVQKYLSLYFIVRIVVVYMYITLCTNILTLECMLGHQSFGVCEVSHPYPLHCLR